MLLAGAVTICLFVELLRRMLDTRTAVMGSVLLATDSLFLLTTVLDWGPVALQHLLLVAALVLLVKFHRSGSPAALGSAFFLLGLGLWDKALFIWSLAGLGFATLLVLPKEFLRALTITRIAVATLYFCVGAFPLIYYNAQNGMETFHANANYSSEDFGHKLRLLAMSLNGSVLFDWLTPENLGGGRALAPQNALERASEWLNASFRNPRSSLNVPALFLAALLLPFLSIAKAGRRYARAMLFSLIFCLVTWLQMALTQGAGASAHHTVLLWPFPQLFLAAALAGASELMPRGRRLWLPATLLLLAGANVLVTNRYLALLVRNGCGLNWTDAIYPLNEYARDTPSSFVYAIDWGILDSLRLLSRGRLPLRVGSDPLSKADLNDSDRRAVGEWLADSLSLFIGHTKGNEFFTGVAERLELMAHNAGYERDLLAVISDRNGRPIFEVFRYRRAVIRAERSNRSGSRHTPLVQ